MGRTLTAVVMGFLITALAGAQGVNETIKKLNEKQVADWCGNYYENPRPDWTPAVLRFAERHGWLSDRAKAVPLAIMIGQVIRQNPDKARTWVDALRKDPDEERWIFANALWFSQIPDTQGLIQQISAGGPQKLIDHVKQLPPAPPDALTVELESPTALDVMWAYFIATGDVRYAKRVLEVASMDEGKDADRALLVGAARWSLKSNAAQHKRVFEMCEAELSNSSGKERDILTDIIQNAKKSGTN